MNYFYATETFKHEYERIVKNNSYKDLGLNIIQEFIDGNVELGTVLNVGRSKVPYIKRRIKGRSGYRLYLLLIKHKGKIVLGYIHPKTGKYGKESINKETINFVLREMIDSIKNEDLYEIETCPERINLVFKLPITENI